MNISECMNNERLSNVLRMFKLLDKNIVIDKVYSLNVNGVDKYLVVNSNCFYIINVDRGYFSSVDKFKIDEDNNICGMSFHNSNVILEDGLYYSYDNNVFPDKEEIDRLDDGESHVLSSLTLISDDEEYYDSYNVYNSEFRYLEVNEDKLVSMFNSYLYNYNGSGMDRVSQAYFRRPDSINFLFMKSEDEVNYEEAYYLTHWDNNRSVYKLALLKTYGLFNYFKNVDRVEFAAYFDRLVFDENGKVKLLSLLFSNVYSDEDMEKLVKENGFGMEIDQKLIDLYNRDGSNYKLCLDVLDAYLKYTSDVMVKRLK